MVRIWAVRVFVVATVFSALVALYVGTFGAIDARESFRRTGDAAYWSGTWNGIAVAIVVALFSLFAAYFLTSSDRKRHIAVLAAFVAICGVTGSFSLEAIHGGTSYCETRVAPLNCAAQPQ